MKKNFIFIAAAVAALFASSCTVETIDLNEGSVQGGMKEVTITASIDEATKTSYDADGVFSWTKGDKISILASDNNYYTFTTEGEGASVEFRGELPEGVDLGNYALYPASDVHYFENWQPYFGIDKYKDLTSSFSADLPMIAKKAENDSYSFKHATSALYFTFTNIPDGIKAVKISFENESLQFSGRHKWYYDEPWSLEFKETENADDDRKFIRKVSVKNNIANVYLPFTGTLWGGYDNIINIVGYDAAGNEVELLKDKLMPGKDQKVKTLGEVIPVAPFKIPVNVKTLEWHGPKAVTATVAADASYSRIKEMNVITDADNMYVRMVASLAEPFEGSHLDIFFCDGAGDTELWSGYWATKCTNKYYYQHKGELDTAGSVTKMRFYTEPNEGGRVYVTVVNEMVGGEAYWYFTYPLEYLEQYKSTEGKLYVSAMLWKGWDAYGVVPTKGAEMLEVTLP